MVDEGEQETPIELIATDPTQGFGGEAKRFGSGKFAFEEAVESETGGGDASAGGGELDPTRVFLDGGASDFVIDDGENGFDGGFLVGGEGFEEAGGADHGVEVAVGEGAGKFAKKQEAGVGGVEVHGLGRGGHDHGVVFIVDKTPGVAGDVFEGEEGDLADGEGGVLGGVWGGGFEGGELDGELFKFDGGAVGWS